MSTVLGACCFSWGDTSAWLPCSLEFLLEFAVGISSLAEGVERRHMVRVWCPPAWLQPSLPVNCACQCVLVPPVFAQLAFLEGLKPPCHPCCPCPGLWPRIDSSLSHCALGEACDQRASFTSPSPSPSEKHLFVLWLSFLAGIAILVELNQSLDLVTCSFSQRTGRWADSYNTQGPHELRGHAQI